jgi:hypothetical protein
MLGPMDTIIASKFIRMLAVGEEPPKGSPMPAQGHEQKGESTPTDTFKMRAELMYGGQGKNTKKTSLTSITAAIDSGDTAMDDSTRRTRHKGLDQPRLVDANEEVTGEGKQKLRTQNKKRKQ